MLDLLVSKTENLQQMTLELPAISIHGVKSNILNVQLGCE